VTSAKEDALKSMDDKRAAFTEFMKLKAPVQYWRDKAAEHRKRSQRWIGGLAIFSLVGAIGLYWIFQSVYEEATKLANGPQEKTGAALIVLTVGVGVAATIAFWVARFLSRLYLSERHMAIDAGLRSTLAETYLAMTEEGKVSETDRALVLPALFRSGSDGIVQDDGSVDGLLALIARQLDKTR
jgi:hypothetical protein